MLTLSVSCSVRYTNGLVSLMPRRLPQARHPAATRMNSSACSFKNHTLDLLEQGVGLSDEQSEPGDRIDSGFARDFPDLNYLPCLSGCHTQPLDVVARDFAA